MRTKKLGFTVFEVLIVIVILAILIALLLPAINEAKALAELRELLEKGTEAQVIEVYADSKPKQVLIKITLKDSTTQKFYPIEDDTEPLEQGDIISIRQPKLTVKVIKRLKEIN